MGNNPFLCCCSRGWNDTGEKLWGCMGCPKGVTLGTLGTGMLFGPWFQCCPSPDPGCDCTGTNIDPRGCTVSLNVTARPLPAPNWAWKWG